VVVERNREAQEGAPAAVWEVRGAEMAAMVERAGSPCRSGRLGGAVLRATPVG
jgi:hypothetical protein